MGTLGIACEPSGIAQIRANLKEHTVKDQFVDPAELCTGKYADACAEAGIG